MDYSPYYFKRNGYHPRSPGDGDDSARPAKRKEAGRIALILLIFIPVIAALVAVNVFTDGDIADSVGSWIRAGGAETYYMLIASEHESETEAVAHATVVRANGGAGYVIEENNHYLVALATYFSKSDAESVRSKNAGTEIKEIAAAYSAIEGISGRKADETKSRLETALKRLNEITERFASKTISAATALNEAGEVRNDLLLLKDEALNSTLADEDKGRLSELIDVWFSASDAVISGGYSTTEMESVLRYALCAMAYASA